MSADVTARPLTVATWNVHGGVGRDRHYSPSRIADVVLETGADVIALQEVGSKDSSDVLLDALVGGTGFAAVDGWTCRRGGCDFGNVVLSRFPIATARRLDLTVRDREPRGALDVVASTPQGALRVIGTHLGLWPGERRAQVRKLLGALPAWRPVLSLDRLWTQPASLLVELRVHRSALARAASDHLPLVARLAMAAATRAPDPG